jgi:AcrR family transcriptional regulator
MSARRAADTLPSTERGEETRRHIIEVAATAFAEEGYAATSLNGLIRRAGLTKGAFYFHFPSREALAVAVFRHKQEQWAGKVMAVRMRHRRALDQLEAILETLCDLREQDASSRAIGRLCQELSRIPGVAEEVTPQLTTWAELTATIIRQAQREGDVRPGVDPEAAAWVAVAAWIGMEEVSDELSGGADLRARAASFLEVFLGGIADRRRAGTETDRPVGSDRTSRKEGRTA